MNGPNKKTVFATTPRFDRPSYHRCRSLRGFTLIEMIAVIVVIGAIFALGGLMLSGTVRSYVSNKDAAEMSAHARVAFERMVREIRVIKEATVTSLEITTANRIKFLDANGNAVCFYLNGSSLMRSEDGPTIVCGTTNAQVLADNVSALTFTYWRSDAVTAEPTDPTLVYYVTMAFTVSNGSFSQAYRTTVKPRNF